MHVAEAGRVMSTVLPLAAALIFAFSMSAAWLFSEWFTKPLRELSGAARQVAQGNYNVQVDSKRNDELGDLAQDFNHMAQDVQHASQMQRDLLANVSHDLRPPLTLIKGYAETVRDITGDDKAHRNEQMNIIVDEADRLTALVSSVMELSKVTSGAIQCERVHFDMGQLCDEVSERYDAVCAQNGWELKLELPEEELPVYADPDMMQRALHNLLSSCGHSNAPRASGWKWKTMAPASRRRTCLISSTATTAPAPTRASRAPAWAFPSPRPSSSSTVSALVSRAPWAKAPHSGSS